MAASFLDCIWSSFRRLIRRLLQLFRFKDIDKKPFDERMIIVNVKYGQDSIQTRLRPEWSVGRFKRQLVEQINSASGPGPGFLPLKDEDVIIIFAGKELPDDLKIEDCDVSQNTVVNLVKLKHKTMSKATTSAVSTVTLSEAVSKLNLIDSTNETGVEPQSGGGGGEGGGGKKESRCYFFIYCSASSCRSIGSGRLRVRCLKCKEGTLVVSRDPCSWEDVLVKGRVEGTCGSISGCDGNVAEFYFKCSSEKHNEAHSDLSTVALYLIRFNTRSVPCLACTGVIETVLVFECKEGHAICLDCFRIYCLSRLNERQFKLDPVIGYTLPCPVGCEDSLIRETHHFRLLEEEAYSKYQTFAAEECILGAGGVLCPRPNCGAGILIDEEEAAVDQDMVCNRITCPSCSFVFCRLCLQGYHVGDCSQDSALLVGSQSLRCLLNINLDKAQESTWNDSLSREAILGTTKPCPKCRTATERAGGCMHMVCTRAQCGFNWCWVCQSEWTRDCMAEHWFA